MIVISDHQREAAVDGVDEVGVGRGGAAHADVGALRVRDLADLLERPTALIRAAVGHRDHLDERAVAAAPVAPGRRYRAVDPVDPAQRIGDSLGARVAVDEDLVGLQRALADARLLQGDESLLGVARAGDRVGVGVAELQVGRRERERHDDRHAGAGGQPAPARHRGGPARPRAAGLVVGAAVRPVQPRAELRQHDRQQRDRHERRDERDQHPAVAHRAQERQRQRDQREQADRHRDAAEDDRAAGGLHRVLHRLVAAAPVRALLAPARYDDQRVVDRHAQADQRDQELHDRRHGGQLGQPEQQQERREDRDDRHHQRDEGEERREHEGQHDQRPDAAQHGLDEHPGSFAVVATLLRQRVHPGEVHPLAAHRHAGDRRARGALGRRVLAEGGIRIGRGIDERVDRAPVLGDEGVVTGRGVGHDARARHRLVQACVEALQVGPHAARVDRRALRQGDDGKQRNAGAAGAAVALGDGDVGLPTLLVRHRELRIQRARGGARGGRSRDGDHEPEQHDGALVRENPAGES